MNVLESLKNYQETRNLHKQQFQIKVATLNIIEELFEAHGIHESKERLATNQVYRLLESLVAEVEGFESDWSLDSVWTETQSTETLVDAFCDIQVFAGGEVGKLGYHNEVALEETYKEIESRTGEIIDGKFIKDKSMEAQTLWVKADYAKAKILPEPKYFVEFDGVVMKVTVFVEEVAYGHEIKVTNEINEEEAIELALLWKDMQIDSRTNNLRD